MHETQERETRMPLHHTSSSGRRRFALGAGAALSTLAWPALASSRRAIATMTDGPFYPPRAWREQWADWDADLSRVQRDGRTLVARGEHLGLELQLVDVNGRAIDGAEVEIWQCDAMAVYRHPGVRVVEGKFDPGFQGFGATRSTANGGLRMRTIRPVPYPGRTPHIHIKLRHATFGELSSQLFVAGDAGNARDFLWRAVQATDREMLEMTLKPATPDSGLRWMVRRTLVLPA
jgi:protocatechuate 3,4-dioxygenase, beta subunit